MTFPISMEDASKRPIAMDTPTKQRLIGAAVLIALAVIFLPMLVKGPAPDSGVSDLPLSMPAAPDEQTQTYDLPLVTPAGAGGSGGALGGPMAQVQGQGAHPSSELGDDVEAIADPGVAAGDHAVHFGAYATSADADILVRQLRAAELPGYRERTTLGGRTAWRVRIGPYPTRAQAEAARVRAIAVRDDVGARVVTLNTDAAGPVVVAGKPASRPAPVAAKPKAKLEAPGPARLVVKTEPLPAAGGLAAVAARPAAGEVGFAVQLGAFSNSAQAMKKRDQLRAAGFSAFTQTVTTDKGAMTRVVAGPVVSRAEAEALRGRIKSRTGMDGIVRSSP